MDYRFEEDDPKEFFNNVPLRFHRDKEGVILQSGLQIDVQLLERQGREGVVISKVYFLVFNNKLIIFSLLK